MGHVPSDLTRAPKGQHGKLLSLFFLGFILHLGMSKCFLFYCIYTVFQGATHVQAYFWPISYFYGFQL